MAKDKKEIERVWKGRVMRGDPEVVAEAIAELEMEESRKRATVERWGENKREAMTRLCNAFPTLRGAWGVDPWDAMEFLRWLCTSGAVTGGSRHAGKFVLQVWNSSDDWQGFARQPVADGGLGLEAVELAPFNAVQAVGTWDLDHTNAFKTWVELPFWP